MLDLIRVVQGRIAFEGDVVDISASRRHERHSHHAAPLPDYAALYHVVRQLLSIISEIRDSGCIEPRIQFSSCYLLCWAIIDEAENISYFHELSYGCAILVHWMKNSLDRKIHLVKDQACEAHQTMTDSRKDLLTDPLRSFGFVFVPRERQVHLEGLKNCCPTFHLKKAFSAV